jgi:hypothetical protein
VIVSALRDPRTIWNTGRFDKAMAHFNTMQQLFDESKSSSLTIFYSIICRQQHSQRLQTANFSWQAV